MSREDLIRRLQELSDADVERIAPVIESDLALLSDPGFDFDAAAIEAEVVAGLESARTDPLEANDSVRQLVRQRLSRRP